MKKFAFGLIAVCMVVLLVVSLNGGFDDVENNNKIFNEAAFSMPSSVSGATDATAFLVGEFDGNDGSHLSFDGKGGVKLRTADGMAANGSCTLLQQSDGSAMIRFVYESGEELYAFALTSEAGDFSLTDSDGRTVNYSPVII